MVKRLMIVAALAAALTLALPAAASATVGVASDLGRITLKEPVYAGQRVVLPAIAITNSGTEASDYRMFALRDSGASPGDPAWFTFEPETMRLGPKQKASVRTVMTLPPDLAAGEYRVILVARPIAPPGAAQFNIAAGPRMRITVQQGSWWTTAWYGGAAAMQRGAPWSYLGAVALVALAVALAVGAMRARGQRAPAVVAQAPIDAPGYDRTPL